MDPKPVSTRDLADSYVEAEAEVAERTATGHYPRVVLPHPLPALGDIVTHGGRQFVVREARVAVKSYTNLGGPERVMLSLHLVAWEGEAPYDDPANASMF